MPLGVSIRANTDIERVVTITCKRVYATQSLYSGHTHTAIHRLKANALLIHCIAIIQMHSSESMSVDKIYNSHNSNIDIGLLLLHSEKSNM